MEELSLVSTDDLLTELLERFDNACFAGAKDCTDKEHASLFRWKAENMLAAIGITSTAVARMQRSWWVERRKIDDI